MAAGLVLEDLPVELILAILCALDVPELLHCRLVSNAFKQIIDRNASLQYFLQLAMCNYIDGPTGQTGTTSSAATRLALLQEHIDRWHYLDWDETRIQLPHGRLYEFTTGVYCLATHDTITVLELPSRVRRKEWRMWTLHGFGFDLIDFTFDPTQDLLVLAELKPSIAQTNSIATLTHHPVLHFRTLSTNRKHPMAKHAFIECSRPGAMGSFVIRLMGNTVGALFRESRGPADPSYLQFIDWTTGTVNPVAELPTAPNTWCFVSPDHILVPHRDLSERYSVALCKIDPLKEDGLDWLIAFHFPDDAVFNVTRSHINVYSDPGSLPGVCPSGRPFYIDSERVVKIEWLVMDHRRRVEWVEIYVPGKALLAYVNSADPHRSRSSQSSTPLSEHTLHQLLNEPISSADEQPPGETDWLGANGIQHIAWESWGPRNTRMTWKVGHDNEFQCFMFGTRAVSLTGSSKVTLRTFGGGRAGWQSLTPPPNRDEPSAASDGDGPIVKWFSRNEETVALFHQLGDTPERTCSSNFPYHMARRDIGFTLRGIYSHGVMCDDEHIVLVEKVAQSGFDTLIIFTL